MFVYHNVQTVTPKTSVIFLFVLFVFKCLVNDSVWTNEEEKLKDRVSMNVCVDHVCVHVQAMAVFMQQTT